MKIALESGHLPGESGGPRGGQGASGEMPVRPAGPRPRPYLWWPGGPSEGGPVSATDDAGGPDWTISLRRRPASLGNGCQDDDHAAIFELVCRLCGDDPALGYRQVSAELRRIRGPYPMSEGTEAFACHQEVHGTAEQGLEPFQPGQPRGPT